MLTINLWILLFSFKKIVEKVRQSNDKISRQKCLNHQNCNTLSQRAFLLQFLYVFI